MERTIDGYDPATGTFYASAALAASGAGGKSASLVVYVPQAARMVSLDIAVDDGGVFSVWVTNSNYDDARAEGDTVTWYPTAHRDVRESTFTTKSGCCGAYKVEFTAGSGMVKVRCK